MVKIGQRLGQWPGSTCRAKVRFFYPSPPPSLSPQVKPSPAGDSRCSLVGKDLASSLNSPVLKERVYKYLDIIFLSNILGIGISVSAWACVNICSSLPTVFFSYLPYRVFKECDCPLQILATKETQPPNAGGGDDIWSG